MKRTWKERLDKAALDGLFTPEDREAATEWATCAVSEVVGPIRRLLWRLRLPPVLHLRVTLPYSLWRPGIDFYWAVLANNIERAKAVYTEIQALR